MRRRATGTTAVVLAALSATIALSLSNAPPATSAGTAAHADDAAFAPHVPGQVIVGFHDAASAIAKSGALALIDATGGTPLGSTGALLVQLNRTTVEAAVDRLTGHPDIAFVEPNYIYSTQAVPNDPEFHRLWGLENTGQTDGTPGADISATAVWDIFHGDRQTVVAVIDTGVDYLHPDLAANIWTNVGEVPDNGIDDDGNGFVDDVRGWDFANDDNDPMDDHFHGTHVAGTIGAVGDNGVGIVGVNWDIAIMPLKFLDDEGLGTTAAAIGAVDYAVRNGARILNNSWGGSGFSQALRLAIERAERESVLFVAAAGNNLAGGRDNDFFPFFPATYPTPNIIAVAATDHDDALASFSNFGRDAVDIAAPGVDVYSTFPGDDYGFLNGTSMATPHVAGTLALLLGRYPGIAAVDAKALVLGNVDPIPGLAGIVGTGGRLNAFRVLSDPDDVAPAATRDLRASNPDANRVDLTWTATGDDGLEGTASRYDVRFAPFPIDASNFGDATPALAPPRPGPPGTTEQLRVTGLDAETLYWFVVEVLDEFGNRSPLSNVVSLPTLGPPAIQVSPAAIEIDLFTGESAERTLTLQNLGIGELTYDVVVEGISPTAIAGLGTGHPGAFGRPSADVDSATASDGAFEVSLEPVWPQAGPAAATSDNKEVTDATAAQGSMFSYHEFDAPAGHSNGIYQDLGSAQPVYISFWVRPGSKQDNDGYFVIRDSTGSDAIFFYATSTGHFQVNADVGGNGEVPYEALTWYHVEFREIDYATTTFDYYIDGILIQAGVRFRFPTVRDFDRLDLYSFDAGSEAWWDEIVLTALPPVLPIEVLPATGLLRSSDSTDLLVLLNATGLNGGVYDADLLVASNDPLRPVVRIPVQLRVTGAPDVRLSTTALDFGALFVGDRADRTLIVENRGTDLLEVDELSVDHPDFIVDSTPFALAPGEIRELALTFLPTAEGSRDARLTVGSNDPDEPILQVTLSGNGLLPPAIDVSPAAYVEATITGGKLALDLEIRNSGFSELRWEIAHPGDPHPPLESVLAALDAEHAPIVGGMPGLHALVNGRFGTTIPDGGANMFDGGNFLTTDRPGFLEYTNGAIVELEQLGETGRMFTRKYPGLFLLAADLVDVPFFNIAGSVGAGAPALTDDAILEVRANGLRYRVFVMRSSGTVRPSVNHIVIVEDRPGTNHRVQTFSNQYSHVVYGLGGETRLYYLLFGGSNGRYYDDATLTAVARRFFDALHFGPEWLQVTPRIGQTAPNVTSTLRVELDAFELDGADYASTIRVLTNIPAEPEVGVPVDFHVDAAADIALIPTVYDFGTVFVGQSAVGMVEVSNRGTLDLNVSAVDSADPAFAAVLDSWTIAPGDVASLELTFSPSTAGTQEALVTLTSDDPDETAVSVTVRGTAQDPPTIEVTPLHLELELESGARTTRTLLLRNLAGANLVFDVSTEFGAGQGAVPEPPNEFGKFERPGGFNRPAAVRQAEPPARDVRNGAHPATMSDRPQPTEKAGSGGESFYFSDGFEDGLLDGWLGLGPPSSAPIDVADIPRGPGGSSRASNRNVPRDGPDEPIDVAFTGAAPHPPAIAKGAIHHRLVVSPSAGVVPAGTTLPLEVTIDTERLLEGDYPGTIRVSSNDPARPEVTIGVLLHVTADPVIEASPLELDFGAVPVGLASTRSVTVSNFGFATLTVDAIVLDHPDFTTDTAAFALTPGRSRAIGVTFAPVTAGPRAATMTLVNDSPDGEFRVSLHGNGVQGAEIVVTPNVLDQVQFRGETVVRSLAIRNRGGEPLDYSVAIRRANPPLTLVTLFEDDVETADSGWTTEAYDGDNLWLRTDLRFHSDTHSWTCTVTDTGTYATSRPISAAAISPPIDLRDVDTRIALRFHESFTTEPGWDQCMVDASIDGGDTWVPLRGSYGTAPSGSSRGWVQENLDLTPFAGKIVQLRYYFETIDAQNNAFPGWSFDDVRVTVDDAPWIELGPAAGILNAGEQVEIDITFAAIDARPSAIYAADIEITTSAPLTPLVVVPTQLDVRAPPRAALAGPPVRLESDRTFSGARARTNHSVEVPAPPAGPGTITLEVHGNFDQSGAHAVLTAETVQVGSLSGTMGAEVCAGAAATYALSSAALDDLAADGVFEASVRNSVEVDPTCADNRHRVILEYIGELRRLDFGDVRVGDHVSRPLPIANTGASDLIVTEVRTAGASSAVDAPVEIVIPPGDTHVLEVTWNPSDGTPLDDIVSFSTNDPRRREIDLPIVGQALTEFPLAVFDPAPRVAALPPGSTLIRTRTVRLQNAGTRDLTWAAQSFALGAVEPAAGVVAPGTATDIAVRLSADGLATGDYATALVLDTNDPVRPRIEIPLTLHVRLVGLDMFTIDFTPKFATREGTVEVTLQLSHGFDPAEVLTHTVALQGIVPDATPVLLQDTNRDGQVELILQFDAAAFESALPMGDSVLVNALGEIDSQAWFGASAWVRGRIEIDPDDVP